MVSLTEEEESVGGGSGGALGRGSIILRLLLLVVLMWRSRRLGAITVGSRATCFRRYVTDGEWMRLVIAISGTSGGANSIVRRVTRGAIVILNGDDAAIITDDTGDRREGVWGNSSRVVVCRAAVCDHGKESGSVRAWRRERCRAADEGSEARPTISIGSQTRSE